MGRVTVTTCRVYIMAFIHYFSLIHKEHLFVHWLTNMLLQETVLVQVEADSKPMRFQQSESLTFPPLQPKKIFLNFSRNSAESIVFIWVVIVEQTSPVASPLSITPIVLMLKRLLMP